MARQRKPLEERTFLELNILVATAKVHGPDKPVTRWSAAKAMAGAYMTATRVGEFVGMWAIAKYRLGEVTTESVADFWGMNERTAYRRLDEFRSIWGPPALTVQLDTPDVLADALIANYRGRRQKLERKALNGVAGQAVELPPGLLAAS